MPQPINTSSTIAGSTPALATACLIACPPDGDGLSGSHSHAYFTTEPVPAGVRSQCGFANRFRILSVCWPERS
jgi:hypothetical protein